VDLQRYAAPHSERAIAAADWWQQGWRELPLRRVDLGGEREEPLVLQWAGPLDDLRGRLVAAGWRPPAPWSAASALSWLDAGGDPLQRPVLPRLHDGHGAALVLIHRDASPGDPASSGGGAARWVLRVWRAGVRLGAPDGADHRGGRPLWLGAVTLQRFDGILAPLGVGFERAPGAVPWPLLARALPPGGQVMRTDDRTGLRVMLARALAGAS
jgi:undecaprenyl-diphosphatase